MVTRFPKAVMDALDESGLPWETETGGHHIKIRVAGHLAAIWPIAGGHEKGAGHKKIAAQIRRKVREIQASMPPPSVCARALSTSC